MNNAAPAKLSQNGIAARAILLESLRTMWHPEMVKDLMDLPTFRGPINAAAEKMAREPQNFQLIHDAVLDQLDVCIRYACKKAAA